MEFFGFTWYGPQNYIKDIIKEGYKEPMKNIEVLPLMDWVVKETTCKTVHIPDLNESYNGFPYGSTERFKFMKKKSVLKPVGPGDIYRMPATASNEYGWWLCDPAVQQSTWHKLEHRYPLPISPEGRLLDLAKINNKYATLF